MIPIGPVYEHGVYIATTFGHERLGLAEFDGVNGRLVRAPIDDRMVRRMVPARNRLAGRP